MSRPVAAPDPSYGARRMVISLCLLTLGLLGLAFILYPGSTYYDHAASAYRFFGNSISESGITSTYREEQNLGGQLAFSAALLCAAAGLGLHFGRRAGRLAGYLVAVPFALIPAVPADLNGRLHNYVFFAALLALLAAFVLAYRVHHDVTSAAMAAVLAGYVAFIIIYPDTAVSPAIRLQHLVLQKTVLLLAFGAVLGSEFRDTLGL